MSFMDTVNRHYASGIVAGERYFISGYHFEMIHSKFTGRDEERLILHTDKGDIFAPGNMNKAALDDKNGVAEIVGMSFIGTKNYSKKYNREMFGLEAIRADEFVPEADGTIPFDDVPTCDEFTRI